MEYIETVRCAIEFEGKILLLKKSRESRFPEGYELPGGKSDIIDEMTELQKLELVKKEIKEETNLNLEMEIQPIHINYQYSFNADNYKIKRKVFYFVTKIDKTPEVKLNNIPNEDHHESFLWIEKTQLGNFITGNKISPNSIELLKWLTENSV